MCLVVRDKSKHVKASPWCGSFANAEFHGTRGEVATCAYPPVFNRSPVNNRKQIKVELAGKHSLLTISELFSGRNLISHRWSSAYKPPIWSFQMQPIKDFKLDYYCPHAHLSPGTLNNTRPYTRTAKHLRWRMEVGWVTFFYNSYLRQVLYTLVREYDYAQPRFSAKSAKTVNHRGCFSHPCQEESLRL